MTIAIVTGIGLDVGTTEEDVDGTWTGATTGAAGHPWPRVAPPPGRALTAAMARRAPTLAAPYSN